MVRLRVSPPSAQNRSARQLREARGHDASFVRELSREVFSQFGDYGAFLPSYLEHPSVFATILEERGQPLGFSMLALVRGEPLPGAPGPAPPQPPDAQGDQGVQEAEVPLDLELLAIAVCPAAQGQGVGKQLLTHAISFATAWHQTSGIRSLQLNVAETNQRAYAFFMSWGFQVLDPDDGIYPNGQRSIRMTLPLADPAAPLQSQR